MKKRRINQTKTHITPVEAPFVKIPVRRDATVPEKRNNATHGITLISIIITVIILLILAGVVLNLTIGDRGIFNLAKKAASNYTNAQERELAELAEFDNIVSNLGQDAENGDISSGNGSDNIGISKDEYEKLNNMILDLSQTVEELKKQVSNLNEDISEMTTWKTVDTNLTLPTTEWQYNTVTIPELKDARQVALYDEVNYKFIYINRIPSTGGTQRVMYTNGIPDAYNFSASVGIDFYTGKVEIQTMRLGSNVLNDPERYMPKITKILYTK